MEETRRVGAQQSTAVPSYPRARDKRNNDEGNNEEHNGDVGVLESSGSDAEKDAFEYTNGRLWLDLVWRRVDLAESLENGGTAGHDRGTIRGHIPVTTELG